MTLPMGQVKSPVFIVGCGRSGTTIFGRALSYHPRVTYLNEPRHLWVAAYPETDIWTDRATSRGGKLVLTARDARAKDSAKLHRLFRFETLKTRKPVLVEKTPINNFRLSFIRQIFPDARFIHISRNGVEVARSIDKMAQRDWYGIGDYKWVQLAEYARKKSNISSLPDACITFYERGLLEWRLSTEAVRDFFLGIPDESYMEIRYDDFVDEPVKTMQKALAFIGLDESEKVNEFVRQNVVRRSEKVNSLDPAGKEMAIAGELLQKYL